MTKRIRVLIADDHAPIREGVRATLEEAGFVVCAEVANADDAVEAAMVHRPDVCLLDVDMPGNGLRAVAKIVAGIPDTSVMMLTVSDASEDLFDALRAGANGYLLKDIVAADLVTALHSAARGEVVLSTQLQATLVNQFRGKASRAQLSNSAGSKIDLTPREWDVMELLSAGLSTADIGRRLFLRPGTVRRHVADVVRKLRVRSRAEAVTSFTQQVTSQQRRSRA